MLADSSEIIGRAIAAFVKELRLRLRSDCAEERPNHVLQRGAGIHSRIACLKCGDPDIREVVEVKRGPGKEIVGTVRVDVTELKAHLKGVLTLHPGNGIAQRVRAAETF